MKPRWSLLVAALLVATLWLVLIGHHRHVLRITPSTTPGSRATDVLQDRLVNYRCPFDVTKPSDPEFGHVEILLDALPSPTSPASRPWTPPRSAAVPVPHGRGGHPSMLAILTFKSPEDALTPDQVISRLRGEFERVNVDAAEGRARCERMLKTLRSMNAPSEIIELTERSLATTTWVTVTESGLSFGFVLTDEMNIRIDHEEVHDDLIRRCADVLNADLDGCG